jgi:hypothetical protein
MASDPNAGHIHFFSDYQKDVAAMMQVVEELDMPKPFYLVGVSMGACIGFRAMLDGLPVAARHLSPQCGVSKCRQCSGLQHGRSLGPLKPLVKDIGTFPVNAATFTCLRQPLKTTILHITPICTTARAMLLPLSIAAIRLISISSSLISSMMEAGSQQKWPN